MKRLALLLSSLWLALLAGPAVAQIPAAPAARVNDLARILAPQEAASLEMLLEGYERESSNQLVLLTVSSLEGDTIENIAVRTFERWGLGTKTNNNGVLLLVAVQDRQMRIEVGYGLEGRLTDAISDSIIRNTLRPAFREQRFYEGIRAGFEQIIAATRGEYVAPEEDSGDLSVGGVLVLVFILIVVAMVITGLGLASTAGRRRGGGFWSSGAGGFSSGSWGGGSSWSGGSSWGGGGFSGGGGLSGGGGASGSW